MIGQAGTPYANGIWKFQITFPENYPYAAPKIVFTTKMFHPNICSDNGDVCMDIIKDKNLWKPVMNITSVLKSLNQLITGEPGLESPYDRTLATLY